MACLSNPLHVGLMAGEKPAIRSGIRRDRTPVRLGFTLIEMVVVLTVLGIFAAIVIPNMAHLKDDVVARDALPSLERLISYGREEAIAQRTTAVLSYDSSTTSFTVKQDTTVDANAPTVSTLSANQSIGGSSSGAAIPAMSSQGGATPQAPTAPTPDADNPTINRSVALAPPLQTNTFQVAGSNVSESDFQLRFYSDGTCDGGGISFNDGTAIKSVVIDDFGRAKFVDGDLPDPSTYKWEAGQFEPRQ